MSSSLKGDSLSATAVGQNFKLDHCQSSFRHLVAIWQEKHGIGIRLLLSGLNNPLANKYYGIFNDWGISPKIDYRFFGI